MHDILENIVNKYKEKDGNIIFLLQETQRSFSYIPREAVDFFSEKLAIAPSRFYGVATFYSQFRLKLTGKHKITACCGTACHVKGSEMIINRLSREIALPTDEDTTQDGEFTLERVACLGTCSFAPVVLIDGTVHGKTNIKVLIKEIKSIRKNK